MFYSSAIFTYCDCGSRSPAFTLGLLGEVKDIEAVNVLTRVNAVFTDSAQTKVTLRNDVEVTRLDSRFLRNDSSRVAVNDSRLESESFLPNLQTSC